MSDVEKHFLFRQSQLAQFLVPNQARFISVLSTADEARKQSGIHGPASSGFTHTILDPITGYRKSNGVRSDHSSFAQASRAASSGINYFRALTHGLAINPKTRKISRIQAFLSKEKADSSERHNKSAKNIAVSDKASR